MLKRFLVRAQKGLIFILKGELLFWSLILFVACLVTLISSFL